MTLVSGLRVALALIVAAGSAVAAWWLPDTAPRASALAIGFAVPFSIAPIVIGIQVAVGAIVDPRAPRTTLAHVLSVWWRESLASMRVFLWRIPFRTRDDEPAPVRDAFHYCLCLCIVEAGVMRLVDKVPGENLCMFETTRGCDSAW